MKKLLLIPALAIGLTACEEYEAQLPVPKPGETHVLLGDMSGSADVRQAAEACLKRQLVLKRTFHFAAKDEGLRIAVCVK